jgi:hypothetical protein
LQVKCSRSDTEAQYPYRAVQEFIGITGSSGVVSFIWSFPLRLGSIEEQNRFRLVAGGIEKTGKTEARNFCPNGAVVNSRG